MWLRIERINYRDQRFLTRERVQVHEQGFRCLVQLPWPVEQLPPQGLDVFARVALPQLVGQVSDRVVHQRHQPAEHLQRPTVKARPLPVGTVLVVAARHRIHEQIVNLDPMSLFVPLSSPEDGQHVFWVAGAGRVERMPAVFFGTGSDFPADNGAHGLLRILILEHRLCLSQADLLWRGADTSARCRDGHEQAAGQLLPGTQPVRVTARSQRDLQTSVAAGQIPQGPHARVRFTRPGVEQGVQRAWPALLQDLLDQRHRQFLQTHVTRRTPHRQEAAALQVEAGEQFLAAHVLVACSDIALADAELLRLAWNGVLVEADHRFLVAEQVPRARAAAEGIDLIPGQVTPPATDRVARRATMAATQSGEAGVGHLVQVEDTFQADHQGEDAGQQALAQATVVVSEAILSRGQPVQSLGHQQERARILGLGDEKGGGGRGTGWRGDTPPLDADAATAGSPSGLGAVAAARVARSRPNFLQKWCKATVDTWTSQVRWMKSSTS